MKFFVDLNSDIGEGYGAYKLGMDEEIMKCVTSVNCACGWHAGDPLIMDKTIKIAKENNVAVGAHPGYPDLLGFGRRKMIVTPAEARAYMLYQLGALNAFAKDYVEKANLLSGNYGSTDAIDIFINLTGIPIDASQPSALLPTGSTIKATIHFKK